VTTDELIDGLLTREGPNTPPYLDPHDRGGRTAWGISERAHPEAWQPGPPTRAQARVIYWTDYVQPFAVLDVDDRIRTALVDDAVLSGVGTSIRSLQRVVSTTPDGVIGPETLARVHAQARATGGRLLVRLVQARTHRLARIVQTDPTQLDSLVGWVDRSLSMLG
jgi:lysozyme family protein